MCTKFIFTTFMLLRCSHYYEYIHFDQLSPKMSQRVLKCTLCKKSGHMRMHCMNMCRSLFFCFFVLVFYTPFLVNIENKKNTNRVLVCVLNRLRVIVSTDIRKFKRMNGTFQSRLWANWFFNNSISKFAI